MAKVEMDMTEYELLKENKRLLEDSLKKGRELQVQIEKLYKEKIAALEEAKYKVVKVVRTERRETLYIKKNPDEIFRNIIMLYENSKYNNSTFFNNSVDKYTSLEILNSIFNKSINDSVLSTEITLHSLDDIKAEIRKNIEDSHDENYKEKLRIAENAVTQRNELIRKCDTLQTENKYLESVNTEINKINEDLLKKVKNNEDHTTTINEIRKLISNYNIFTIFNIFNKIKTILK